MGLKSHLIQNEVYTDDVSYIMNETGTRGHVVVQNITGQSGTGEILDDSDSIVKFPDVAYTSGEYPVGVLTTDVVNYDLTRQHLNGHQRQAQVGGKVGVLKIGTIVTDNVAAGVTVQPGRLAYGTTNGKFTTLSNTLANQAGVAIRPVGTFRSTQDADGYCRIDINVM